MRSDKEISEQLDKAVEGVENGTKWPGQSYEDGVMNALNWILGQDDVPPMEEG